MTAWQLAALAAAATALVDGSGPPTDFIHRLDPIEFVAPNYYSTGGSSVRSMGTYSAALEDVQRGQEGLVVKLNDVIKALKEDELKLNNVFYKLGRHDTSLEGVDATLHRLTETAHRIEAKLNKHAFNVDFLRRKMEHLRMEVDSGAGMEVEVSAVRSIVNRLDDRLTDALARLGLVENTTKTLEKRSVSQLMAGPSIFSPAARPPTLTVYPQPREVLVSVTGQPCQPAWEQVGLACYWFGGEELTYTEAVAACLRHGGLLLTLPAPGTHLQLLLSRLQSDTEYWTSGTDAFSHGNWAFLMTAQPVMPLHWVPGHEHQVVHHHHCAALGSGGLSKRRCTNRLPYLCHTP